MSVALGKRIIAASPEGGETTALFSAKVLIEFAQADMLVCRSFRADPFDD
jgi:hypothetical protein